MNNINLPHSEKRKIRAHIHTLRDEIRDTFLSVPEKSTSMFAIDPTLETRIEIKRLEEELADLYKEDELPF